MWRATFLIRAGLIAAAAAIWTPPSPAAQAEPPAQPMRVVFVNPGGESSFWGMVSATMAAAAEDLEVDLEILHSNRDRLAMLEAARAVAARTDRPDVVVLVNELEQGPAMLREMRAAGVPTFFLLNKLSATQLEAEGLEAGDPALLGAVTPDNARAGYDMARSLIAAARRDRAPDAPVALLGILGDAVTPAALQREAGLRRAVAEDPNVRLARAFPVLWSREEARRRAYFALRALEIDGVWGANDDLALGAQEAARALGRAPGEDLHFAGLNWSAEGVASVAAGEMTMSHGGHFFAGAWAMVLLRDWREGVDGARDVRFQMSPVDPENAAAFRKRLGARNWRAIDFRAFSRAHTGAAAYDFSADAILAAAAAAAAR